MSAAALAAARSSVFALARKRGERGLRVLVQFLFAFDVGFALGDQLAETLRRFAGAGFLGFELFARHDQAVMGGGFFRFVLAQRRQLGGGIALHGRGLGGVRRCGRPPRRRLRPDASAASAARADACVQRRKCASASALRIWPERLR